MGHYRGFLLDELGDFVGSLEFAAKSDDQAGKFVTVACQEASPKSIAFEVWQSDRLVASSPNRHDLRFARFRQRIF